MAAGTTLSVEGTIEDMRSKGGPDNFTLATNLLRLKNTLQPLGFNDSEVLKVLDLVSAEYRRKDPASIKKLVKDTGGFFQLLQIAEESPRSLLYNPLSLQIIQTIKTVLPYTDPELFEDCKNQMKVWDILKHPRNKDNLEQLLAITKEADGIKLLQKCGVIKHI